MTPQRRNIGQPIVHLRIRPFLGVQEMIFHWWLTQRFVLVVELWDLLCMCYGWHLSGEMYAFISDKYQILIVPFQFCMKTKYSLKLISLECSMASPTSWFIWSILVVAISASPQFQGQIYNNVSGLLPDYDYVIIGGGTSGLVVANRLSEDAG
jgi:hypothetical protein